jgi:hypothetical protein
MAISTKLAELGVVRKVIDSETDPTKPIWWSRHAWKFDEEKTGVVRLRMYKLSQNGREILYSTMPLGLIDALAGVPSFHPGITNVEAAELALFPPEILTYQRALIKERIPGIKDAWKGETFCHTGTISLHVPPEYLDCGAVTSTGQEDNSVIIEIDLKKVLFHREDEYIDVDITTGRDRRPLHVIDGQHRKVSCETDTYLQNFEVMINILPLGSTYGEAAQLFTELNVTNEALRPLHQLHQRYTCFIPHREAQKDYGDPEDEGVPEERRRHRRANRRAFTLAMMLALRASSPLFERVQTMELPNRQLGRGCSVTSKKFVDFARNWFLSNQIFENMPDREVYNTFCAYLGSWRSMTNQNSRGEDTQLEGWELNHTRNLNDPFITRPLPFESILMMFPLVYAHSQQAEGTLSERFESVLKPLLPIDFTDYESLYEGYGLTEETPKALFAWFSWAISNHAQTGAVYLEEEVWNPLNKTATLCKPGRGFFSPPDRETIEGIIEWSDANLVYGSELKVWMRPYPNVHSKPFMSVKYLNDAGVVLGSSSGQANSVADEGHALYKHLFQPTIQIATKLQIQIIVKNLHGEAQIQETFDLNLLRQRDGHSHHFGRPHGIPEEWLQPSNGTVLLPEDTPDREEEDQTEATDEISEPRNHRTVVKVDEQFILPPLISVTKTKRNNNVGIVPDSLSITECIRCRSGIDCGNAQCIGKSIRGYSFG